MAVGTVGTFAGGLAITEGAGGFAGGLAVEAAGGFAGGLAVEAVGTFAGGLAITEGADALAIETAGDFDFFFNDFGSDIFFFFVIGGAVAFLKGVVAVSGFWLVFAGEADGDTIAVVNSFDVLSVAGVTA